jgi:hypothetical protein
MGISMYQMAQEKITTEQIGRRFFKIPSAENMITAKQLCPLWGKSQIHFDRPKIC